MAEAVQEEVREETPRALFPARVIMSCPTCGYRIPLKKFEQVLETSHGDCLPNFMGCYVQKGVKGMFWESVAPSMDGDTLKAWRRMWRSIRRSVSTQMLVWLNRYGLDADGEPMVVRTKRFSEFNGSTIPLVRELPLRFGGPRALPVGRELPLTREVVDGQ